MKKFLLPLFVFTSSTFVFAQKISTDNVPPAATSAFAAKFPKATAVTWEMDYENYEADFKLEKIEMAAKFDKEGKWLETETPIKSTELPKAAKDAIKNEYGELSELKLTDCEKLESPSGISYEVTVSKGENHYDLEISDKGNIHKKEKAEHK
jgi:Putative beta-lactamase-inhibitor-like, PepSY-like